MHELGKLVEDLKDLQKRKENLQLRLSLIIRAQVMMKKGTEGNGSETDNILNKMKEVTADEEELLKTMAEIIENEKTGENAETASDAPEATEAAQTASTQADEVVLELDNLPAAPSKIQCPKCGQSITAESSFKAGTLTWLACFASVIIGCVLGCCLIPFYVKRCKETVERCPECKAEIHTDTVGD